MACITVSTKLFAIEFYMKKGALKPHVFKSVAMRTRCFTRLLLKDFTTKDLVDSWEFK